MTGCAATEPRQTLTLGPGATTDLSLTDREIARATRRSLWAVRCQLRAIVSRQERGLQTDTQWRQLLRVRWGR